MDTFLIAKAQKVLFFINLKSSLIYHLRNYFQEMEKYYLDLLRRTEFIIYCCNYDLSIEPKLQVCLEINTVLN